ncbi:hypothetical protein [Yokenella regensburgei]|uniref:hypothetical protein n=1 Tax=Yokenella regensburgei TaxID=158877 RepID=UPI0013754AF2|nr:hypothetical protein [Yokenella regensburgei]KAF1366783.1 hypothetical protein FHR25_004748 [Yokenella regensburgei]
MRTSFKRASEAQRKEYLADDVAALSDEVIKIVESGDFTMAKMLKLQFMMGDIKFKAEVVAGRREH